MIVLTGDVHHAIGSADQRFVTVSETALAVEYARIAARYGLKVTLFLTGRAAVEEGESAGRLAAMENVEVGGHGWDALRPRWWHGLLNRVIGSPHGPPALQRRAIRRTCRILETITGQSVRSWRNHAYRCDRHTPRLLAEAGIVVWSDVVQMDQFHPRRHPSGVVILPINTLPDHEHLYHGARTPDRADLVEQGPSYFPGQWLERVCRQVERIVRAGGIATVLAHPICMRVADGFATFEGLCVFLSRYPSMFASEVVQLCDH
ncbi:MAG TPA: polysaccharide deacetylase family protein [Thermoflexia bacterium]|jgi:peptidoglycan/xylan/chitin deacetylase (PgdA/CDA1 family)|nr:polysaccharide deacetylase family protein [Thermoflexia bacterium]